MIEYNYGVYAGNTQIFTSFLDEWADFTDNTSGGYSIEDVFGECEYDTLFGHKLEQILKKTKVTPPYQYIINYAFKELGFTFDKESRKEIFEAIDNKTINTKKVKNKKVQMQFNLLVTEIAKLFEKNGLGKEFCDIDYIKKAITNIKNKEDLYIIAFGFDMDIEILNLILTKAMHQAELDYYDPVDFIHAVVIMADVRESRFNLYNKLKNLYNAIEEKIKVDKVYNTNISKAYVKHTEYILDEIIDKLSLIETVELYNGDICDENTINPIIADLFEWHCRLKKPEIRTSHKIFKELLNKVKDEYSEFISDEFNAQIQIDNKFEGEAVLEIVCNIDKNVILPKESRFFQNITKKSGETGRVNKRKVKEIIKSYFVLKEDVEIVPDTEKELELSVKTVNDVCDLKKENKVPAFIKKDEILEKPHIKTKQGEVYDICSINSMRHIKTEKDKGSIIVLCSPGTIIEKDTKIEIFDKYGKTEVCVMEDACAVKETVKEIVVYCEDTSIKYRDKKENSYYLLAETGAISFMVNKPDWIISIKNNKRIRFRDDYADKKKSGDLAFQRYFYESNDFPTDVFKRFDINIFGRWFTDTKIDNNVIQGFSKKADSKKRDYLLTLIFFDFVKGYRTEIIGQCKDNENWSKIVLEEFEAVTDKIMDICRMHKLYLGYPYDLFLCALLETDAPVDALRALWKKTGKGK